MSEEGEVTRPHDVEWVDHGYNSVRFRCRCGILQMWHGARLTADGRAYYILCECGIVHVKPKRNFRGEG